MLKTKLMVYIAAAAAVIASASLLSCNRSANGEGGKDGAVAAMVNGKNIMLSEVDRIISQQAKGQQAQMSPLENAAARIEVLNGLIQQEVLFQRAEKEKLLPSDDEIAQAINEQKQQNHMTEEEYQKYLRENNQTEQDLRDQAKRQIAIKKLQDKISSNTKLSDKEVEDYYNSRKSQFVNARGVGLAVIIANPNSDSGADPTKTEAGSTQKINFIYQQLKSGADFATVAREKSEDPSNVRGGDIGFATEEQLKQNGFPPDLIAKFFGPMQVGDITPPVKSQDGRWSIFKLTSKRLKPENLTLDSPGVSDQIKETLISQRRSLKNEALLEVSMSEAKVENKLAADMLNSPDLGLRPAPANAAAPAPPAAHGSSPGGKS